MARYWTRMSLIHLFDGARIRGLTANRMAGTYEPAATGVSGTLAARAPGLTGRALRQFAPIGAVVNPQGGGALDRRAAVQIRPAPAARAVAVRGGVVDRRDVEVVAHGPA